jgi:hypothetical protein
MENQAFFLTIISIVVAALAISVTILLGFQIWKTIDYRNEKKRRTELEQFKNNIQKEIDDLVIMKEMLFRISKDEAMNMIFILDEVVELEKLIKDKWGKERNVVFKEEGTPSKDEPFIQIGVFENTPEYITRAYTFKIDIRTNELLINNPIDGNYINIFEWRNKLKNEK